MKTKVYRHGEILFVKVPKIPKLAESKTNIIEQGSHGHDHTFKGGKLYIKKDGQYIIGYLAAKNTILFHPEHGKGRGQLKQANLPDGKYEIRKQAEFTPQGLVPVID